jgi:hypothetical protein
MQVMRQQDFGPVAAQSDTRDTPAKYSSAYIFSSHVYRGKFGADDRVVGQA